MIGKLGGNIIHKDISFIILDVNGVGYKINVLPHTIHDQENTAQKQDFWIQTIVRQDSIDLYGFKDKEELDYFNLLLSVSGIGPKKALIILSVASPDVLRKAIISENSKYLTNVSGVGQKNAEKIVLELKGKITGKNENQENSGLSDDSDVIEAIKSLGYTSAQAREALKKVPDKVLDIGERIKETLKVIGKR